MVSSIVVLELGVVLPFCVEIGLVSGYRLARDIAEKKKLRCASSKQIGTVGVLSSPLSLCLWVRFETRCDELAKDRALVVVVAEVKGLLG